MRCIYTDEYMIIGSTSSGNRHVSYLILLNNSARKSVHQRLTCMCDSDC